MATPFDRALELNELHTARDAYALRHGPPRSADYRAAWLRFHQRVQTIEDLQQLRRNTARRGRQVTDLARRVPKPADRAPVRVGSR